MNMGGEPESNSSDVIVFKLHIVKKTFGIWLNVFMILSLLLSSLAGWVKPVQASDSSMNPSELQTIPSQNGPIESTLLSALESEQVSEEPLITPVLKIRFDPPYIPVDGKINLSWQLDNAKSIENTQLSMELPPDMLPEGIALLNFDSNTSKLTFNLSSTSGQIPFKIDTATKEKYFPINSELTINDEVISKDIHLLSRIEEYNIGNTGGTINALEGLLDINFDAGVVSEDINVYARFLSSQEGGSYTVNGGRFFELTARGIDTGQEITEFNQPLTLTVKYPQTVAEELENSLAFSYYDEKLSSWVGIPLNLDTEKKYLYCQSRPFHLVRVRLQQHAIFTSV
jgi:hypothetical protein